MGEECIRPAVTVDGKYDEKAAQAAESLDVYICMMLKTAGTGIQDGKARAQLSALLAYRQTGNCTIRWIAGLFALLLARNA